MKIYRSTTGINGTYTELTGPSTRIALSASQTTYTYSDTSGESSYYYETSFFNSNTLQESSRSEPIQGVIRPALDVISAAEVRALYLWGLNLTDPFTGVAMPDSTIEFQIESAVDMIQSLLDLVLTPTVFTDEIKDYYWEDYRRRMWLKVNKRPVTGVQRFQLIYPSNQNILLLPLSWVQIEDGGASGQLQIVPAPGDPIAGAILGYNAMIWPLISGYDSHVPSVFHVDYTAGFPIGKVPPMIKDVVGLLSAINVLAMFGDIIYGPGLSGSQVSLDNLMTNTKTTKGPLGAGAFAGRIALYRDMIDKRVQMLRRIYAGIPAAWS